MRKYLAPLFLVSLAMQAQADQAEIAKLRKFRVCEIIQTAVSICINPCTTWAQSQPDFQFSFDVCVADCQKREQEGHCSEVQVR